MVSQPGATFVSLQVRPAFRQIKSESYLDKMSENRSDHSLERSGSFVTSGKNDSSGICHLQNIPVHASISKSEIFASKSDTLSYHSDVSNKSAENVSVKSMEALPSKTENRPQKPDALKPGDSQSSKSGKSDSSPEKNDEPVTKPSRKLSLDRLDSCSVSKLMDSPKDFSENALDKSHGRLLDSSYE